MNHGLTAFETLKAVVTNYRSTTVYMYLVGDDDFVGFRSIRNLGIYGIDH